MAEISPIHLEYTYTQQEWLESRLAAPSKPGSPKSVRVPPIVALVGFAVYLLALGTLAARMVPSTASAAGSGPSFLRSNLLPFVPWVVLWGTLIIIALGFFWWRGRSAWKRNPLSQRIYSLDLDGQGIQVSTKTETTRWRWEAFVGFSEPGRLLILETETKEVLAVPKRAANAAQLEQLRQIFRERAGPRSGGFPVQPSRPAGN
jgi:hypothetical protein